MPKITKLHILFLIAIFAPALSVKSQNLLTNGDFESSAGYQSNYNLVTPSGNTNSGDYAIVSNPQPMNTANFISSTDHTSSAGKMMVVDGRNNDIFWKQNPNIALQGGSSYLFSYYIKNINTSPANPAKILFTPADQCDAACGTSVTLVQGNSDIGLMPAGWQKVSYRFTPSAPGTRYIRIELSTIAAGLGGNDFAIDDISLTLLPPCSAPVVPTGTTYLCQGSAASPFTVSPDPGYTLLWYVAASGGIGSPITPTPSTSTNGTTIYYVSQTNGVCESPRAGITVTVNSLTGSYSPFFCDPNQATAPNTVYFDWQNLPGPPIYHITYSIDGGPPVNIQTNISHYEVFGVGPNQSVTLTIVSADGYPCVGAVSNTCCSVYTTPVFAPTSIPTTICSSGPAPVLPTTSDNGLPGTWTPATVSTTTSGSYVFTPTGPCTTGTVTRGITVTQAPSSGTLSGVQNVCVGSTTTFSSTSPGGTWSSSALGIATVITATGVITGVSTGTAIITYSVPGTGVCGNASAIRNVTVAATPSAGTLSGNQNICTATATSFASTVSGGTWTSANTAIATVNPVSGLVSGVTAGTATITYTVTSGSCSGFGTRTVTVTAAPLPGTLSGGQNICVGLTTTFSSTIPGGSWSSSNAGIASVNTTTGLITGVTAGIATITYSVTGTGGCSNVSATRTVTVTAAPIAGSLGGNQNICVGSTTTFNSTAPAGNWTSSNIGIATVNSASGVITGVTPGTATITYTVTGTGGCANATTTRTVTVTAVATAGTLSGNQNVCVGLTTSFSSTVAGGAWTSSNSGIASINIANGQITGVAAGTATITYTITGTGGCGNATATRTVTVAAPPTTGTLNGNQNVCAGLATTFSSTIAGGSWSSSNASVATVNASTGIVTGITAGTSNIIYSVTGTGGCANVSATRTVTVTAAPNAGTISGTSAICIGSTSTLTATGSGGNWASSNPAVATVNATTGLLSGISAGAATITYTVTGTGGCSNVTASIGANVTAPANAGTLSGNQNICEGTTTPFTTTGTGGNWTSSNPAVASINSTTGLVTGFAAGTATMTYKVIGTGGCSDAIATRNITIIARQVPTFNPVGPICSGTALAPLPTTSINGFTGTWSPALSNTTSNTYTFTPNATSCATTTTLSIVVNPRLTALFDPIATQCLNDSNVPVLPLVSQNGVSGTWSPSTVSLASLGTQVYNFTPNASECVTATPISLSITVVAITTPNFPQVAPFCYGKINLPTLDNTSPNGVEGTWNPTVISNTASGTYVFTPNTLINQCATPQILNVTVIQKTQPNFPAIPSFCVNTTAPVFTTTSPNGVSGTWSPAIIDNTVIGTSTYVFTPNANECALPQTLTITVTPGIMPNFKDVVLCKTATPPVLAPMSPNSISGTWTPPAIDMSLVGTNPYTFTPLIGECGVPQTINVTINEYVLNHIEGIVSNYFEDLQVITVIASNSGDYWYQLDFGPLQESNVFEDVSAGLHTIKVIDQNNCGPSLSKPNILVINYPKYFTPNDDNYNDTWNIKGLKDQPEARIFIFDRYGKLVKEISPSGDGWDGKYNGRDLPSTDYWFTVDYLENNVKRQFKAHFSLKR